MNASAPTVLPHGHSSVPTIWTLVLAGGTGARLMSVTKGVPKPYWRRGGGPALVEATLERFDAIAPPSQTVIVVAEQHRAHVEALAEPLRGRHVVFQPLDRGTAAGVALGLLPILERDSNAIVVVSPCDHGIEDVDRFHEGLRSVIEHVERHGDIVLCGVEATGVAGDYGWIVPASTAGSERVRPVLAFHEKPARPLASVLYETGAVWNTMVTVAYASALFGLYRQQLPEIAFVFVRALQMRLRERTAWLATTYESLPSVDFSRDLMAITTGLAAFVWPAAIGWTDLGTPDRLPPVPASPLEAEQAQAQPRRRAGAD